MKIKFLKCCPSERVNEMKISKLIMSSLMSGESATTDASSSTSSQSTQPSTPTIQDLRNKDTIDFLHFIRYLNIIYKSDCNERLKFLYGVSMNSKKTIDLIFFL